MHILTVPLSMLSVLSVHLCIEVSTYLCIAVLPRRREIPLSVGFFRGKDENERKLMLLRIGSGVLGWVEVEMGTQVVR